MHDSFMSHAPTSSSFVEYSAAFLCSTSILLFFNSHRVAAFAERSDDYENFFEELSFANRSCLLVFLAIMLFIEAYIQTLGYFADKESEWARRRIATWQVPQTEEELMRKLEMGDVHVIELDG